MWAPGAYLPDRGEGDAVHANIGVEKYFFEAGDQILNRIKEVRGHGDPAGADGPDRGRPLLGGRQQRRRALVQPRRDRVQLRDGRGPLRRHDAVGAPRRPGATGVRASNRTGFSPGDTVTVEPGTPNEESRERRLGRGDEPAEPGPERDLRPRRSRWPHPAGSVLVGRHRSSPGVGFQPAYATEGKFEALEFAAGNYGLLESAYDVREGRRRRRR